MTNMKKFYRNIWERIKSRWQGRRNTVYEIESNSSGMTVQWLTMENTKGESKIIWSDVVSAKAFKRDFFYMDCICLEFALASGRLFEVSEEMNGWKELISMLPNHCLNFLKWIHGFKVFLCHLSKFR
jgi:hypothetical protein